MQAFQDGIDRFEESGAQVLGVSSDDLETHAQFAKEHGLSFPLISDRGGAVQKLYAPGRVTFLIDKKGEIRQVQAGQPDLPRLLEELVQL